jgi:hypothetical protein
MNRKIFSAILAVNLVMATASVNAQQVYFGNLHSHTSYSDGSGTPQEAYKYARDEARIDFMAITEHNHKSAQSQLVDNPALYNGLNSNSLMSNARKFTQDGRFIALYGQEFSSISAGNHVNVLDVDKVINPADVPNGRFDLLFNNWLRSNLDSESKPAIVLLNHPSISSCPNEVEYGIDDYNSVVEWRTAIEKHACLINVMNGPSHKEGQAHGKPSESEFKRYLDLGLHVAPTADQDNHLKNWGLASSTRTGLITTSLTKANVLKALRDRNVYATEDDNLRIIGKVNGELMGKIFGSGIVPATGTALTVSIDINDDDEPLALYKVEVFADNIGGGTKADVIKRYNFEGDGKFDLTGLSYGGGDQYFYVRITQTNSDGEEAQKAFLAPVWFEPNRGLPTAPAPMLASTVSLTVDEILETAIIKNIGTQPINLKNWTVVSINGNQTFKFLTSTPLAPGQTFTLVSGPNAQARLIGPPVLRGAVFSNSNVWSNSGDPAQLLDAQNNIVAEDLAEDILEDVQ